jgi:glucokinase
MTAPGLAVGVDVGGTKVLGVALAADGAILAEVRLPTPPSAGPHPVAGSAVADVVAQAADELLAAAGASRDAGVPVGVGVPGLVGRDGHLVFAPNLQSATGARFDQLLAERLGDQRVVVENDANCAALAEQRLGAGRQADEALIVTLGTGIGGGVVTGGHLVLGAAGFGGEVGHMVVDPSGPPCGCGRRGCWERYASGSGLGRLAREAAQAGQLPGVLILAGDPEAVRGEHVMEAAVAGDVGALGVLDQLAWWVALGLANLAAITDPERIVLGGGLVANGELLLAPIRRSFAELLYAGDRRPAIAIVAAEMGERAGAVGAALAARSDGPL